MTPSTAPAVAPLPVRPPSTAPNADVFCSHCGLPVPSTAAGEDDAAKDRFCCAACELAHAIIQGAGLGAYYEQQGERGRDAAPARPSGKTYAEYDDPAFAARHLTAAGAGSLRLELFLSGIHCTACVWLVERLPRLQTGVRSARFDLGRHALAIEFEPASVRPSEIARALDRLGYAPHPSLGAQRDGERRSDRALWLKLGIAGALAGNVMLMALALYSGAAADPAYAALFRWGSCLLALPSVFFCGSVFLRGALASLRARTPHMDLPISIGIVAGFARSAWNTALGSGEVYFDSLSVLIFLLLVGRWLQARHHRGAAQTLDLIAALAPATARRVDGGQPCEVPADAVPAGALVEVLRDERIPVDGIVVAGESSVDTAWFTGEAVPEAVKSGDRVYAGTVNVTAPFRLRVEVAGSETRLGRLLQSVAEAQAHRAPIVRLADRVAGYFVYAALGLALVTFALWRYLAPSLALDHAVALLVVTCPCALGMATPLAVSVALKRAARSGIFFKGGEFLEALARPGTLVFDKTGTLTEGRLALAAFTGDAQILPLLRAAEERSGHPIARAIVAALPGGDSLAVEEMKEFPGAGVAARVSGHAVRIGSAAFVREGAHAFPHDFDAELRAQAALGRPAVAVAIDGEVSAVLAFDDPLRSDARASLDALRAAGYRVAVLSGDQPLVVEAVARELGPLVTARGGLSPEDKLAWVERARRDGSVVMIGDGINDAAAMSAADVALAVHGGAEAALVAADAFTTVAGVGKVLEAVQGARRTLAVIRRGIAFSLAYNLIGVGLCMAGVISPLVAAVLMPLSSLTVVTSALRARTFAVTAAHRAMLP